MNRDRADTPRSCPLCSGDRAHADCRLCGGMGVVDAATAARWLTSSRARHTSTGVLLADVVALMLERLRVLPGTGELVAEGQVYLDEILSWRTKGLPPRSDTYDGVGDWRKRAADRLAEEHAK